MPQQYPSSPDSLESKIEASSLKDAVERAASLSFLCAFVFGAYGLTSIDFINRFDPAVSAWNNTWPRLLFNTLPLLALGWYLLKGKSSDRFKFYLWIAAYSAVVHVAAWVYVWQISLWKSAVVLTYVHAANTYIFAFIYAVVAPPRRFLIKFTAIFAALFLIPLIVVAHLSNDPVVFSLIVSDSFFSLASGIFLSRMIDRLRSKVARLELERTAEASRFLGPVVSKAIFGNQSRALSSVRCKGFVVAIDVRGSTDLQKQDRDRWLGFRKLYFALISEVVAKHGGYIQKTVGDCHVINFGIMDYDADLSDIPGLEKELGRSEERRLQHASDSAFGCLGDIFSRFNALVPLHYPSGSGPALGAGIDKGVVERGVQGDGTQLELDVNGDPVNCSNRLQEYSKHLRDRFEPGASLLVISPFASDYLGDCREYVRVSTLENPVRNYQDQIKWVLVREFRLGASNSSQKAA